MSCNDFKYFIIFGVIVFGFSISELVIYTKSEKYSSSTIQCPEFANNTSPITLDKEIFYQWHWTYKNDYMKIVQHCPTITHEVNVFLNNSLVAMTHGDPFSITSKMDINDCKGDNIFVFKASDIGEVILNQNKVFVNKVILDNNSNKIGYVKGTHWFVDDNIDIIDINGNTVVNLHRDKLSIPWKWNFDIKNFNSKLSDMRLLSSIAGKVSFSDSGNDSDICNTYFWYVLYVLIAIFSIIVIIIFYYMCKSCEYCKNKVQDGYTQQVDNNKENKMDINII